MNFFKTGFVALSVLAAMVRYPMKKISVLIAALSALLPIYAIGSTDSISCAFAIRHRDNEVVVSRLGEVLFRGSAEYVLQEMDRYVSETACSVTPTEGSGTCDFELKQGKKSVVTLLGAGFRAYQGDSIKTALHMMLKMRQLGACAVDVEALPACKFAINPFGKEAVLLQGGKKLLSSREGDVIARARIRLVEAGYCR